MEPILREPYEISLWEDRLAEAPDGSPYYKEVKIATIGSDTATARGCVTSPVLTEKVNGEVTLTFDIAHRYYDDLTDKIIDNPFVPYLINERKIKLFYKNKWYDFIIKNCSESSNSDVFSYEATSLFANELGKVGYNITLSADLNNNQGTVFELAEKAVEGTDWIIDKDNSDIIQQFVAEPLYKITFTGSFTAYSLEDKKNITISDGDIYVFYSFIKNRKTDNVAFIWSEDFHCTNEDLSDIEKDDDGVVKIKNYRFISPIVYQEENGLFTYNDLVFYNDSEYTGVFPSFQAYRLAYNQKVKYDPIKERTVKLYKAELSTGIEKTIYNYTDYEYLTSNSISNLVNDGSEFNIYSDGSLEGWSNATQVESIASSTDSTQTVTEIQPMDLVTYPEVSGTSFINLKDIDSVEGYLRVRFRGTLTNDYKNIIFNDGFETYRDIIGSLSKGEKYVFRARYGYGSAVGAMQPPTPDVGGIKAIVAKYTTQQVDTISSDEDSTSTITNYLYTINPDEIYLQFNGEPQIKNNEVTGGYFKSDFTAYYKDDVVVTPAPNYVYQGTKGKPTDLNTETYSYVWNGKSGRFIPIDDTFLNYYYIVAECKKTMSNTELNEATTNLGIFLYTDDSELVAGNDVSFFEEEESRTGGTYVYLNDVQLFKYKKDADNQPVLIGNVPSGKAIETEYYYLEPKDTMTAKDIETYSTIEALADHLGVDEEKIIEDYNENYEKISSIDVNQSNCFNIIQELAESFECWPRFHVRHDDNGCISLNDAGAPYKSITFHNYCGKDNYAGFKYGINLNSIERTVDSSEFVTKLIVEQVNNDAADDGTVSITTAEDNISKESYILNFDYYLNNGLVPNREEFINDINEFYDTVNDYNTEYDSFNSLLTLYKIARIGLNNKRNVYSKLIKEAEENFTKTQTNFKTLTGISYKDYVSQTGLKVNFNIELINNIYYLVSTFDVGVGDLEFSYFNNLGTQLSLNQISEEQTASKIIRKFAAESDDYTANDVAFIALGSSDFGNFEYSDSNDTLPYFGSTAEPLATLGKVKEVTCELCRYAMKAIWFLRDKTTTIGSLSGTNKTAIENLWENYAKNNSIINASNVDSGSLTFVPNEDNESLLDLIGNLFTSETVKRDYSALLNNVLEEKADLDLKIDGTKDYLITVTTKTFIDETTSEISGVTKINIDDYIEGLEIVLTSGTRGENSEYRISSSYTEKYFTQDRLYDHLTFNKYPSNYQLQWTETINDKVITHTTTAPKTIDLEEDVSRFFELVPIEKVDGYEQKAKDVLEEKNEFLEGFYKKYSRFIQEGTWTSQDYIDSNLYYLDALKVSKTSAKPKVSYNLNVAEIGRQYGFENYNFTIGDKTYIEDPQFFGYEETIQDGVYIYEVNNDEVISGDSEYTFKIDDNVYKITSITDTHHNNSTVSFDFNLINKNITITSNLNEGAILYIIYKRINKTPIREEVIVSEAVWNLDKPAENSLTIQNYKTQFEDLFSRIAATVQNVEYNGPSYMRAASMLDSSGLINGDLLAKSLNELSQGLILPGNIEINEFGVVTKDRLEPAKQLRLSGSALSASTDNGFNWTDIITADGISTNALTAGIIDTQQIQIMDGDNASFRWDKFGLNAYGFGNDQYDLKTYVRFDKYGLYGVQNGENFQAQSLEEIQNTAQFGLTWNGFFIKNSYADGYVSISSDEDFQVVANDIERIKIGALEKTSNGYQYGIRIKNDNGDVVFKTDDDGDIEITGVINATGGVFSDRVQVGTQSAIILDGSREEAIIGSSNYFDNTSNGWAIKAGGDAVFNNITARGAIKTAVFEYEEIQAVGGAFLFRPSTTIRNGYVEVTPAEEEGGEDVYSSDLTLEVENSALFKINDWCKVSNYNSGNVNLGNATGLADVYRVKSVDGKKIVLEDAAAMFDYDFEAIYSQLTTDSLDQNFVGLLADSVYQVTITDEGELDYTDISIAYAGDNDTVILSQTGEEGIIYTITYSVVDETKQLEFSTTLDYVGNLTLTIKKDYNNNRNIETLVGGALISFGNLDGTTGAISDNYGIGINSSDNYVNLPARAISLFESTITPDESQKVHYNMRGILGTLPSLENQVSSIYEDNMVGTQGIYTNNMYIGDNNQFIAFYEDSDDLDSSNNPKKKLKIQANQVMFEITDDEGQGTGQYQDISDIEAEGVPGAPGEDAIRVAIESDVGNEFIMSQEVATLTCTVYKGSQDVTSQVTKFLWTKNQASGSPDTTWNAEYEDYNLPYIEVTPSEINKKAIFGCTVTLPE